MDIVDFGKRIKQKREESSLTQEELAEKTNLSVGYIGMIERGKRLPSLDTFVIIADELDATADELLYSSVKKSYKTRLQKYEEKLALLNRKEIKKVCSVLDVLLEIES